MHPIGYKGFSKLHLAVGFHKPPKTEILFLNEMGFVMYRMSSLLFDFCTGNKGTNLPPKEREITKRNFSDVNWEVFDV